MHFSVSIGQTLFGSSDKGARIDPSLRDLEALALFMKNPQVIWLASYPRSGNTLLRTVLYQCFGIQSASVYPNDLGGNKALQSYIGHIEHEASEDIRLSSGGIYLIKTHEPPHDDNAAIYIVRDGRAACVSLWEFDGRNQPLEAVVSGGHRVGAWADHLKEWRPWERPNTLLVKYEDIIDDLSMVLERMSQFLHSDITSHRIPSRELIASVDGRWVRMKSDWRNFMTDEQLNLFNQSNGHMMRKMGYGLE